MEDGVASDATRSPAGDLMIPIERLQRLTRGASGRAYRSYADIVRLSRHSGAARDVSKISKIFENQSRRDLPRWNLATEIGHENYRNRFAPASGTVALLCSCHRPSDVDNVVRCVSQQVHDDFEFVFIAHGDNWDLRRLEDDLSALDPIVRQVTVLQRGSSAELGDCLNAGLAATNARFVGKIDSDDWYGPHYLRDALRAHSYSGAGIVGKHTYYSFLESSGDYFLRFPGNEFRYTSTMSGGTFLIDRDIVDDMRFASVSIGEDRDYLRRCHRRGISTFSGDRFNYVVVRSQANTWRIADKDFVRSSIQLGSGLGLATIDR